MTDRSRLRQLCKGRLTVVSGPDCGRETVIDKPRFRGGRSDTSDLVLRDIAVSGGHFELLAHDDGYRLRDLDSESGTHVGRLRVRDVYLQSGMSFRVGATEIQFETLPDSPMLIDIELSQRDLFQQVIGTSPAMREIFDRLERVAPSDLTCLITGETGTGKELIARAIHDVSSRRDRPFVALHCGSLPVELIESTLFGHEKGAFTGAAGQHLGCFEQAQGGTIFLDEIGELDVGLQPKLLRVLEQRELTRLGGRRPIGVDVRVLAATNRDLHAGIEAGRFREDLYYRLSVIRVLLPALRQRREDILLIAEHFLREVTAHRSVRYSFDERAIDAICAYAWPGNVRQLKNVVERAVALCDGPVLTATDLSLEPIVEDAPLTPEPAAQPEADTLPVKSSDVTRPDTAVVTAPDAAGELEASRTRPFKQAKQDVIHAFEVDYLAALIARNHGNISGAAREAGITRYHLRELLKRHQLTPRR